MISPNPDFPLKAELHCHSYVHKKVTGLPILYDSVQPVEQVLDECLKKDIRILALTDHNTLDGYRKARQIIEERQLPILLIPACEISTREGHVLAYGIMEEIPEHLPTPQVIEHIHFQGGLAVAAHPYMPAYALGKYLFSSGFDALEGFNSLIPSLFNKKSIPSARQLGIPHITGSDAHIPVNVGRSVNLFPADTTTVAKFLAHLKAGRFVPAPRPSNTLVSTLRAFYASIKYSLFHK